jgi:hypothetical protein
VNRFPLTDPLVSWVRSAMPVADVLNDEQVADAVARALAKAATAKRTVPSRRSPADWVEPSDDVVLAAVRIQVEWATVEHVQPAATSHARLVGWKIPLREPRLGDVVEEATSPLRLFRLVRGFDANRSKLDDHVRVRTGFAVFDLARKFARRGRRSANWDEERESTRVGDRDPFFQAAARLELDRTRNHVGDDAFAELVAYSVDSDAPKSAAARQRVRRLRADLRAPDADQ